MALIEFRGVGKVFDGGVTALDGVDLDIEAGEVHAVIGHSGAGKSTLVRLVNALERPTSGTVVVDGVDITALGERALREVRKGIGMVFQQFNLMRSRTVFENVAYPLRVAKWGKAERERRVTELLHFVGIAEHAWRYPGTLSGGQKQRVGIARALAANPKVLLADEATSALDPETTGEVLRLLKRVNTELGVTIVVITHEMEVVRAIADRVSVIEAGRLVEHGDVRTVFANPRREVTRRFVATALHDRPAADDLVRIRARHPGRLVTARVRDDVRIGPALTAAATAHGVAFEIVHGGIKDVGGAAVGSLTLELTGPDESVDKAITALRATTPVEELA